MTLDAYHAEAQTAMPCLGESATHAGDTIGRFINATFAAPTRPSLYEYAAVDQLSSDTPAVMNAERLPIVSTKDQRHEGSDWSAS